jgi:hypothetical protein
VGIIALLALLLASCGAAGQTPAAQSFSYQVRVLDGRDNSTVARARVTLDVANQAPLDALSDNTGLARILVSEAYVGRPGRITVEAQGFETYVKNIDLSSGVLPAEVQLTAAAAAGPTPEPAPSSPPASSTATPEAVQPTSPPAAPSSDPFVTTIRDVEYTLDEARFDGSELLFWFIAKNAGADKEICLRYSSSLVDAKGTPHGQAYRTNGTDKGIFDCFNVALPYGVPARFGVVFNTVAPSATSIPLLKVALAGEGAIELRDIPIPFAHSAQAPAQAAPTPARAAASQFTITIKDVDYELVETTFSGSDLLFWFKAVNTGADKEICLSYSSSLIDEGGKPQGQAYRTNGTDTGIFDCFNVALPNTVPVRFGVAFNTLPPSTKQVPFLKIVLGGGEGEIQLRNVPIPYGS